MTSGQKPEVLAVGPRFDAPEGAVLQPHHGSGTIGTCRAMDRPVRDGLAARFAGRPPLTPVI